MKIENYEYIKSWCTPVYYYEEGMRKEEYWVDSQNMFYHKFEDEFECENNKKYWIISLYKPKGTILTKENMSEVEHKLKWLVSESYLDNNNNSYKFYEWDFENHCVKLD